MTHWLQGGPYTAPWEHDQSELCYARGAACDENACQDFFR